MAAFTNLCNVLQGRCAAVLMFHTQLALLPAMETEGLELDLMMDDPYGEGVEGPGGASTELVSATVGNSYVVNLAKMGIKKVQMQCLCGDTQFTMLYLSVHFWQTIQLRMSQHGLMQHPG